ncbi:hypothetical protein ABPG74_008231 [Tetrahymena malaccensis]
MVDSPADRERIKNIKGIAIKHFAAKQNAQAIFILEKLLAFTPKDDEIYQMIAQNYSDQDMNEEAIHTLQEAIKKIGPTKRLNYSLCVLLKDDDFNQDQFKKYLQQLLQLDQNDIDTLFLQASVLQQENQLLQAIEVYKKIHSLDKNCHVSLRNIAMNYKTLGKYAEALEYAQKSLSVCKEDYLATVIKAKCMIALNQDVQAAQKMLDEAETYVANSPSIRNKNNLRNSQVTLISELKQQKLSFSV